MEGFADMLYEQGLNILLLKECFYKANPVHICYILVLGTECNQKSKQVNETFVSLGKNFCLSCPH